jgi:hypothetical protein
MLLLNTFVPHTSLHSSPVGPLSIIKSSGNRTTRNYATNSTRHISYSTTSHELQYCGSRHQTIHLVSWSILRTTLLDIAQSITSETLRPSLIERPLSNASDLPILLCELTFSFSLVATSKCLFYFGGGEGFFAVEYKCLSFHCSLLYDLSEPLHYRSSLAGTCQA